MTNTAIQAEYTLLAIAFGWLPAIESVSDTLQPEHFSDEVSGLIYRIMLKALARGDNSVDAVTVFDELDGAETLARVHEISLSHAPSAMGIGSVAKLIISKAKERQLYRASKAIATLAFEAGDIDTRIDQAQAELAKLVTADDADEWVDAHTAAMQHLELIDSREQGKSHGITTGLSDLDEMLDGGFQRGNLVVIGARPAMGKTAMGMTMSLHIAQEYSVGFLSMEMPHADVRDRQTAILGNVSISNVKRPKRGLEYDRVVDAIERAKTRKFFVSDKGGLNILQVRAKARALKRVHGLDVLVVDYIGLMSGTDTKVSRAYQIEEISRGLKTLAKELEIVVICLAQVNRGAADKGNTPPALHELRDSGAIEQDADVVAFIHRPIQAQPELGQDWDAYGLLRISKNRQGRTGDVHLFYVADQTRFGQWSGAVPSKSISNSTGRGMP
jgi:replicative DNA helicase